MSLANPDQRRSCSAAARAAPAAAVMAVATSAAGAPLRCLFRASPRFMHAFSAAAIPSMTVGGTLDPDAGAEGRGADPDEVHPGRVIMTATAIAVAAAA